MYSIAFPRMFANNRTLLLKDHEATLSNLRLLLASDKGALFGDPYYGSIIKRLLFNQADNILKDILIDGIYTCILTFMPQIRIARNNIDITIKDSAVYAHITCTNLIDYQTDMYDIKLTDYDTTENIS